MNPNGKKSTENQSLMTLVGLDPLTVVLCAGPGGVCLPQQEVRKITAET
jgi:hypothetical protein